MNRGAAGRGTTPAVVAVLDEVAAWRLTTGDEIEAALVRLAEEERAARRQIDEGNRRFAALGAVRREHQERLDRIDEEAVRRKRAGVRGGVERDRALIEARAAASAEAASRRDRELATGLDDPHVARAVAEYLEALEHSASLRGGLVAEPEHLVSGETRACLAPYLSAAAAPPPSLPVALAGVGVIVSVDPVVGPPEALVVVVPVPWSVYTESVRRPEDLCTQLAYRMVAAVYGLLVDMGVPDAPVRFVEVHGSLGIQVWIGDHVLTGDLRERTLERVASAVEGVSELEAAAVEVYAVWLAPDLLAEAASA